MARAISVPVRFKRAHDRNHGLATYTIASPYPRRAGKCTKFAAFVSPSHHSGDFRPESGISARCALHLTNARVMRVDLA